MKNLVLSLLPDSLSGRIIALYGAGLLTFIVGGLGWFYYYQFTDYIDEANESAALMAEIIAPTITDSVVIGDYDTVRRTLQKVTLGSRFDRAFFLDVAGASVRGQSAVPVADLFSPDWLKSLITDRLYEVNRIISVGGQDYGVLRMRFSPDHVAGELWKITRNTLYIGAACFVAGIMLIGFMLRGALANEALKNAVLEASLDSLIIIDYDGRIVDFNPAAERTFGFQSKDVKGRALAQVIIPPALREAHNAGMERYRNTGQSLTFRKRLELTAMRSDGSELPVELAIVPVGVGGKAYFCGYLRDISEKQAAEQERKRVTALLEESVKELGYQKFALDAHSLVSISDASGKITYVNAKFAEVSGYSAEELVGKNHRIIKSGLHSRQFFDDLWSTIRAGKVWHGQICNRTKDGEIYWVEASIVPWLDDEGRPYQYVAIRTDITRQKKNEQALEEARQRELEIGTSIQRSLLKDEVPDGIQGAWLASFTEPSQGIDGDFYAIRHFRADCFEILVGDVMGKGVPAALIGAAIKTTYNQVLADLLVERAGDRSLPTPAAVVNRLHQALTPRLIGLASFATLALYRFDLAAGTLTYVNAGHTPGLLMRADEPKIMPIMGDNLPIGVLPEEVYVQSRLAIDAGDALLVYSDGISEARKAGAQEFGLERLTALLEEGRKANLPPATMLHSIRGELRRFVGGEQLTDDQTALMVELHHRREPPRGRIEQRVNPFLFNLPWSLNALATLRSRVEESAWFLPEKDRHALVLAAFEAATNIIRHAPPLVADATLTCRVTRQADALAVELIYPSEAFSPPTEMQPDFSGESEGGFGLFIIEQSVDTAEYGAPMPGIGSIRLVKRASALPVE